MLFEVKISDQYVNILSILRGKAVNIQYQYLEGRESMFIQSLTGSVIVSVSLERVGELAQRCERRLALALVTVSSPVTSWRSIER